MANAFFLNATPYVIAVNLNTSLQNQILAPEISVAAESATLAAWKAPIAATPRQGEFGGNNWQNLMLVISEGSSSYMVWDIHSSVSVALNLYFYILGDQVVGMDATGSTGGIRVSAASKVVATRVFMRAPPAAF
ncbi:MAG: hypothetical protein AABO41_26260 [Acidobacteriota bacterium]